MDAEKSQNASVQLGLGTLSFIVCFAAWGLISSFAPRFGDAFHLTATQAAFLVAVPVILGALARIPMGMLTDLYGGRTVFAVLMLVSAVPPLWASVAGSYNMLLAGAFCLGLAGSSFAVGVGFVSRWYPPHKQGTALGVYGLGNIGQSAVVFFGPVLAATFGWQAVFRGISGVLVAWAVIFFLFARNSPNVSRPKTLGEVLHVIGRERLAWVLAAFYGLTFGGFVAFSIYLPTLLKDQFHLNATSAGLRRQGSSCSLRSCGPLAVGYPIASAARRCCPSSFLGLHHFRCCWRGRRWSRSRRVRLGVRRCWVWETGLCSNWCRNISKKIREPLRVWWER
jgi:NNP family nitrate/nitrite transporter-like MFS transporter